MNTKKIAVVTKNTVIIFTLVFSYSLLSAATLRIDSGQYTGVDGLVVGSDTYNVTFRLGVNTHNNVYDELFAEQASIVLYSTFSSGQFSNTLFDTTPGATYFCGYTDECMYLTATSQTFSDDEYRYNWFAIENSRGYNDEDGYIDKDRIIGVEYDETYSTGNSVFLEWTKVKAVPVPAAIWLMGSGLLGLMGFSRNNKTRLL